MIDHFTKEDFERALPKSKTDHSLVLWKYEGLDKSEHCYSIPIDEKSKIFIRSSVKSDNKSADTGKDSIRIYLVNNQNRPIGSKISKYITRVPGWQTRLIEQLRFLFRLRRLAGNDSNNNPMPVLKVEKEGPNKGRFFTSSNNGNFKWLTDNEGNLLNNY